MVMTPLRVRGSALPWILLEGWVGGAGFWSRDGRA